MSQEPREPIAGDGLHALTPEDLQSRAMRGAWWTIVNVAVSLPVAFIVNLLLGRLLGPEGYGRLAFLTTLIDVLGLVATAGLSGALLQFGAAAHARGDEAEVRSLLSRSQGFRLLVVAPITTIVLLLVVDVPTPLFLIAIIGGVWLPNVLSGGVFALQFENRTATEARIVLITSLITQVAVVVALLALGTADSVWATRVLVAGLGAAVPIWLVATQYRAAVLRPRFPRGFPSGFWRFALPAGFASLIATLAVSRSEVFFLTALSDAHQVGLFALAFGLAAHLLAPAAALLGPLLPALSGLRAVAIDRMAEAFHRSMRATATTAGLIVSAGVAPLACLLPTLYGADFTDAAPMFLALGATAGAAMLTAPLFAFVMARRSGRTLVALNLVSLVIDAGLCLLLIPAHGAWGAVIANTAAVCARAVLMLVVEARDLRIPLAAATHDATPAIAGSIVAVATWVLTDRFLGGGVVGAVIAIPVGLGLFVVALRLTRSGFGRQEVDKLQAMAPQRLEPLLGRLLRPLTRVA